MTSFSPLQVYGIFFPIWPNFELVRDVMDVLVTYKYEEDLIKNEGHYNSMVAMETSGRIWPNFELIQALIHVLITCKYEKNPIKNSGENVMTSFSPF